MRNPIQKNPPQISIVVNTHNRAESLNATIESFRHLNYVGGFEVIVVNGPSTDDTASILERWQNDIRVATCSDRNLSISRNIGIQMARGDIVAFIDDDAKPDEDWLDDIASAYDCEDVGGAGGFVYSFRGYIFQYKFGICDRMGRAETMLDPSPEDCAFPGTPRFPHLIGTNATYRRSALLEIGGFDEEFDYYLDETDVCLRLTDAGYLIRQVPRAFVYHQFLPSSFRGEAKVPVIWYPILKNKAYFLVKHSGLGIRRIWAELQEFSYEVDKELKFHLSENRIGQEVIDRFHEGLSPAFRKGLVTGLMCASGGCYRYMDADAAKALRGPVRLDGTDGKCPGEFRPFSVIAPASEKLTICLLSQQYPPGVVGGIGRLTYELANALAANGHIVHVLTRATFVENTVDWEDGVWVHRIHPVAVPQPAGIEAPEHLWAHSAGMLREIQRIHATRPVDIVEAPIWDAEGIAVILDGGFTTITSLETPLKMVLETMPEMHDGSEATQRFFDQLAAAEVTVVQGATAVRAISGAIRDTVSKLYGTSIGPDRVSIVPVGIQDRGNQASSSRSKDHIDVLFTGRFERRKGIDLLLNVIPALCRAHQNLRFILVGEDSGQAYTSAFRSRHAGESFLDRVLFPGKVSDEKLDEYLALCDVFVAPSRYESFGIVFLEAMMFSKPTVGTRVGGIPEVVLDGITGLLAEPGHEESLRTALHRLVSDSDLRSALGNAGRQRFVERFTREKMAELTIRMYRAAISRIPRPRIPGPAGHDSEVQPIGSAIG